MGAAIATISIGAMLVYSALKGISIPDLVAGKSGDSLNPHGSSGTFGGGDFSTDPSYTVSGSGGSFTAPAGGAANFKGPKANLLSKLAGIGVNNFNLTVTATTNGTHVPGSYHYSDRAYDISGEPSDMAAYANYLQTNYASQLAELIHNGGSFGSYAVKDGKVVNGAIVYAAVWQGHRNHVHVAA